MCKGPEVGLRLLASRNSKELAKGVGPAPGSALTFTLTDPGASAWCEQRRHMA